MSEYLEGLGVLLLMFLICGAYLYCLGCIWVMRLNKYYKQLRQDEEVLQALSGRSDGLLEFRDGAIHWRV